MHGNCFDILVDNDLGLMWRCFPNTYVNLVDLGRGDDLWALWVAKVPISTSSWDATHMSLCKVLLVRKNYNIDFILGIVDCTRLLRRKTDSIWDFLKEVNVANMTICIDKLRACTQKKKLVPQHEQTMNVGTNYREPQVDVKLKPKY